MKKFTKSEKKKCRYYVWGKCISLKVKTLNNSNKSNRDCKPLTTLKIIPNKIENCRFFEETEHGKT